MSNISMNQVIQRVIKVCANYRLDLADDEVMFALADCYLQGMIDAYEGTE